MFVCLFKEKEKEHKVGWGGRWGGSVRNWGKGKHDHDALYEKNSKRTTTKRSQVIDGKVSKWSSPVYQACEDATGNLGELKNYRDNFLGKAKVSYMPLLSGAGEIPFHSTLTSC